MGDEPNVRTAKARTFSATLVRRCKGKLETGVPRNERAQLATRVSARAEDANRDSMHAECILLHSADVNRPGYVLSAQRCVTLIHPAARRTRVISCPLATRGSF